jgi:hypothetical protein
LYGLPQAARFGPTKDEEIVKTVIHRDNQNDYLPKGPKFNTVSKICQPLVQRQLIQRYSLGVLPVNDPSDDVPPIHVLATPSYVTDPTAPFLMIIPGKGDSRAGILSTKQIVLLGMEVGSAEFYLQKASTQKANMAVLLLDPNARGPEAGMSCLEVTLTALFGTNQQTCGDGVDNKIRPLFILAHSAAGGYLVRYLLLGEYRRALRDNIRAICFTDSTHNIQRAKSEDPDTQQSTSLFQFLQSDCCLYIRNTATHPMDTFANSKDRKLGDTIPHDVHWERRFGTIPTVWAGTTDHSLICWTSRRIIWDFFQRHIQKCVGIG